MCLWYIRQGRRCNQVRQMSSWTGSGRDRHDILQQMQKGVLCRSTGHMQMQEMSLWYNRQGRRCNQVRQMPSWEGSGKDGHDCLQQLQKGVLCRCRWFMQMQEMPLWNSRSGGRCNQVRQMPCRRGSGRDGHDLLLQMQRGKVCGSTGYMCMQEMPVRAVHSGQFVRCNNLQQV